MEPFEFNCKIITPVFCYGADENTPEIRAESIRGAMRFWWRALHPNLVVSSKNDKGEIIYNYKKLYEAEAAIFGSTKTKSAISIVEIKYDAKTFNTHLLPHKNIAPKDSLIDPFSIKLKIKNNVIDGEYLKNLLFLVGVLGGIGRRTRRGFGRFVVDGFDVNKKSIEEAIKCINPNFNFSIKVHKYKGYPYYLAVHESSTSYKLEDALIKIGKASHKFNSGYSNSALGYTKGGRLASTIIAGVVPSDSEFKIIAVRLGRSMKNLNDSKVPEFINAITT